MFSKKIFFPSIVIISVILADQVSKHFVLQRTVAHTCNSGIAFGLLPRFWNEAVSVGVICALAYVLVKVSGSDPEQGRTLKIVGLSLVLAGGISNLVDRMTRGCVLDFIDLKIWPSFNLADSAIILGVIILIFKLISFNRER